MTLYEINQQIEQLLIRMFSEVDEETGEVSEDVMTEMAELNIAREEKLDNIGAYIKNLEAECKALKEEEDALKERRTAKEKKLDRLKNMVTQDLLAHGETSKESTRVKFSFRKSESVSIEDERMIPFEFGETKTVFTPDRTAIKKAIKDGIDVPGAVLVTKQNIQIK